MSQRNWFRRHWRLIAGLVAYALFAPVGLLALPLAALLIMSPPLQIRAAAVTVVAGGFGLAWILQPGDLPDQVVRTMAVVATASFVPISFFTRAWVSHKVCAAAATAAVAVTALLVAFGRSLSELQWWVEHRMGYAARFLTQGMLGGGRTGEEARQLEEILDASVRFVADYHLALVTLQAMAGLALATAAYHRLASSPRGEPPGRFSDFTFTDHLGWAAIAALLVVLVPMLSAAKLGALNVLVVLGTLFGLRGVAVVSVALERSKQSYASYVLSLVVALLLLPAAIVGAILLGIADTRFDLRRRAQAPPSGG